MKGTNYRNTARAAADHSWRASVASRGLTQRQTWRRPHRRTQRAIEPSMGLLDSGKAFIAPLLIPSRSVQRTLTDERHGIRFIAARRMRFIPRNAAEAVRQIVRGR